MARYCPYCGNQVGEGADVCLKCGRLLPKYDQTSRAAASPKSVVDVVVARIRTNSWIWVAISAVQIVVSCWYIFEYGNDARNFIWLGIVGVLNLISSADWFQRAKEFANRPIGIVRCVQPLASPIIALIYNLFIGGVIGIAGSIYYLIAVRGYVIEHKQELLNIEATQMHLYEQH